MWTILVIRWTLILVIWQALIFVIRQTLFWSCGIFWSWPYCWHYTIMIADGNRWQRKVTNIIQTNQRQHLLVNFCDEKWILLWIGRVSFICHVLLHNFTTRRLRSWLSNFNNRRLWLSKPQAQSLQIQGTTFGGRDEKSFLGTSKKQIYFIGKLNKILSTVVEVIKLFLEEI